MLASAAMALWQAVVLGVVQGLTEFLPISSSGHLELIRQLLGWSMGGLAFDVALHWGTLLAILVYFRRDWLSLARGSWQAITTRKSNDEFRLCLKLVVGSIPAAVAGVLLADVAETVLRSPWIIVTMLGSVGFLLIAVDRRAGGGDENQTPSWKQTILIGLAQAVALIPGTSRSGITMLAGIGLGLPRAAAARFSFLLAAPIILGAGLFKLREAMDEPMVPLLVGIAASAISGGIAIAFLLRYLKKNSFRIFGLYRIALAIFVAAVLLIRG